MTLLQGRTALPFPLTVVTVFFGEVSWQTLTGLVEPGTAGATPLSPTKVVCLLEIVLPMDIYAPMHRE
jgi:hypothetical protein